MKRNKIVKFVAIFLIAILSGSMLSACGFGNEPSKQRQEIQKESSQAFDQQRAAVKYPADELRDSLERRNIRKRLLITNNPNTIGYVYYAPFGKLMGYWTIKGKVSSVKSQMNPADELTDDLSDCSGCFESQVIESAGDDGAFGENQDSVYFFTTEDVMVEVPEDDYFYSTQPVTIGNIPELSQ